MTQSRKTSLTILLFFTVIGGLLGLVFAGFGALGYFELQTERALTEDGVLGTAEVIDTKIDTNDCYVVKYKLELDGVDYFPIDYLGREGEWTDCLQYAERIQSKQFGTIQVIYLPSEPENSRPAGPAYFHKTVNQVMTSLCMGSGIFVFLGLIIGWWVWFRSRNKSPDQTTKSNQTGEELKQGVYPLFTQYEVINQKIGIVDAQRIPIDPIEPHLAQLQAENDNIDQWIVIDHFGRTPLGKQQVAARVLSEQRLQKPTPEAVAALVHNISVHAAFQQEPLTIKFGILTFEVAPNLRIPLAPLLSKTLPKDEYLILSNQTEEVAGFQVQSIIFPTDLDQQVNVIRHDRYPTSGRYPSSKVLDMIQAAANTHSHLQLVVPRKEGRGQKFEVHSSYQTVSTAGLSAAALFSIARAIHAAGLASDDIRLDEPNGTITLSVSDDLSVFAEFAPQPQLTRVRYLSV